MSLTSAPPAVTSVPATFFPAFLHTLVVFGSAPQQVEVQLGAVQGTTSLLSDAETTAFFRLVREQAAVPAAVEVAGAAVHSTPVPWFSFDSADRYEPDSVFLDRLQDAAESSAYARRLELLLQEPDPDFEDISVLAARRAWDVLREFDSDDPVVRIFQGDRSSIDLQVTTPDEVRLLTAGPDGYFESRALVRANGELTRRVRLGPDAGRHFLRTGGDR